MLGNAMVKERKRERHGDNEITKKERTRETEGVRNEIDRESLEP